MASRARLSSAFARVLLVVKTPRAGAEARGRIGGDGASEAVARARWMTHARSCAAVREVLRGRGIEHASVAREALTSAHVDAVDLVIALGGDGTTLAAARAVGATSDAAILGVNTDPATKEDLARMYLTATRVDERRSTGHLCAANRFDAVEVVEAALDGRARPTRLARIRTKVNGETLEYALNDVLIAHSSPAAVSRYSVRLPSETWRRDGREGARGGADEPRFFHVRSSGIRTCTASGSTAAMYSAGGEIMPLSSTKMQYMDREPIYYDHAPTPSAGHGYYERDETLRLRWNSLVGTVYIDGDHVKHDISLGDDIEMSTDAPEVNLFVSEWFEQARARKGRALDRAFRKRDNWGSGV